MLVGERMSHPVTTVQPDLPIVDALNLMKRQRIRRVPVVKDSKLVGIVSDKDLLNASPSPAASLSVWEMNYLLSKTTLKDVMTKKVITVAEDTPIEEAARLMADNKIGGLPVLRGDTLVGIITETDLFKIFIEMMGARQMGVRATLMVPDRPGQLVELAQAITQAGGNFIAFSQFEGDRPANRMLTFKVTGMEEAEVRRLVTPLAEQVVDIRTCC